MYSKEQISKIRQLINAHFERGDVYDKLKQKINSDNLTLENLDNQALTKILRETNLIDNLLLDIKHLDEIQSYNQIQKQNTFVDPDKINYRSVTLRIYKGKAFLDFIREELNDQKFLQIYLSFCGQRFQTITVPASVEPEFNELFVFDLRAEMTKASIDLLTLSKLEHPIEMSMMLIDVKNKTRQLYSYKLIEWRFLLSYGNISLNIEMPFTYTQKQMLKDNVKQSAGLLQIHMELLPKTGLTLIPEHILTTQLSREKALAASVTDRFHTYASAWWNDYKELKLPIRPVKLYAESQDGIWRPSCTFVRELSNVRGIPSPNHAARFVSLLGFRRQEKGPQANDERLEIWHRFGTFLAMKQGDFEDHCLLLCSLFLGFNMEAYVVIGSSSDGAHGWVMTRLKKAKKPGQKQVEYQYNFWESLTGHKFELNDPRVQQMYKRIGCIFNNQYFFANIQSSDLMSDIDLNVEDYTKWKAIDPLEIQNLKNQNFQLSLIGAQIRPLEMEQKLEHELRSKLTEYRKVLNLLTRFDEKLGSIMQIALVNYEVEKVCGVTFAQQEFQCALRTYIPEGHIFKAFPIQFNHMDSDKILEAIKQAPVGGEIVTSRGDQNYFALRVRMELYPEDVYAIWVSISVRYHVIVQQ